GDILGLHGRRGARGAFRGCDGAPSLLGIVSTAAGQRHGDADSEKRDRSPPHLAWQVRVTVDSTLLPPSKRKLVRASGKLTMGTPFGAGQPAERKLRRCPSAPYCRERFIR